MIDHHDDDGRPQAAVSTAHREAQRIAAVHSYNIVDTPAEPRFDRIARMAAQVMETPIALVSLLDETRQWVKASYGLSITDVPRQLAFCHHAIRQPTVTVVENALCDPRFFDNPMVSGAPYIRFYAAAPLRNWQGHNLGTLCVLDRQPRRIGPEQQRLLEDLAAMVIDELETRRSMQELKQQAITDPLTGIHNRRQFLTLAEREVARAARYDQPLCLLMADIDRFKRINDTYGHETGDRAICATVEAIQRLLRPEAVFGRFGGEEFAILLPQADLAAALVAAERFRHAVRRQRLETEDGPIGFTLSIGVAPITQTTSLEHALQRADLALYDAKNAGRNRVRVFQAM
ncbi:MAG TPA: sensor domain-containing diguanylate cyclase [Dongiaceae bacterium]|nr:sensor domain-containing diguanylate cyclase [Dongiaceae bacterium]